MKIKNFALPVGIALVGGLSGLMALAKGFGHVWPYSLMAYGMRANAPQQMMESGILGFIATCGLYIMIFVMAGSVLLSKEDV